MAKASRKPFELKLSADQREDLALDLTRSLDEALSARSATEQEVQYFHTLYEQGRTRGKHRPWADAADLTSYLGTMYTDVLRSQIVRTVMLDPVFVVEGYGDAEQKAPFVEEFHSWQLEVEGFQQVFARGVHLSLIEPRGVIEVYEDTIRRPVRKVIWAKQQQLPDGTIALDDKLQPVLEMGPDGRYIEANDGVTPASQVEIDSFETACCGPRLRTIAYRDYLQLPGHARDRSEVWGHAKRFYRRVDELQEAAKQGRYDKAAVEELGTDDERTSETSLSGEPIPVAAKNQEHEAEKELWEILFLRDLDGKGLRWYVATLHKDKSILLRVQYDDLGRSRFFSLVPFPKPNSTEGYSYIGHKLITVIEEHTAWRNMLADRAALQLQAPLMRKRGALWDPDAEPIGPKSIIPFNDPNEIQPLQLPDMTAPAIERIQDAERAGERLSGINDAAAGVQSQEKRTLGEIQLITEQSMGRSTECIKNLQETLEEIAQVRHLMWKRALAEQPMGLEAPPSVLQGLEARGADVTAAMPDKRFTALMLEGTFRFKPRGSVEDADLNRKAHDFTQGITALGNYATLNPMVMAVLQTPQAAKAIIEAVVRYFKIEDKQAFLGSAASQAMMLAQQQQQMMQMMQMMGPGAMAGGPGAPPPGSPPAGAPPAPSPMGGGPIQ
jgi:hypothetical protein